MTKEEELFKKRLIDLANVADRRNIAVFSDFLGLNELNIFHSSARELSFVKCQLFGGYASAERQIIAFISDASYYEWTYPISCIRITPLHEKYAEALSHRDYLGAVLNLGIDRSVLGDILVCETCAYLFCLDKIADFLCRELTRIRHTSVMASVIPFAEMDYQPNVELIKGSVASVRLDTLLALAFHTSRSKLTELVEGGRVFVNGKLVTSNGYRLKEGDLISARGLGRFRYLETQSETKKGRMFVALEKFV